MYAYASVYKFKLVQLGVIVPARALLHSDSWIARLSMVHPDLHSLRM